MIAIHTIKSPNMTINAAPPILIATIATTANIKSMIVNIANNIMTNTPFLIIFHNRLWF